MLKINPKKTKIIVFQERTRKCAEFRFFIGNLIIDVVQELIYLLRNSYVFFGELSVSREHLKEKALHALFSLRRHPAIACKSPLSSHIIVKFGVCMQKQILRLGTVHKLKKHTFNFANGT